ncbi:MAG: Peptidase family [Mucilaginibacter sp.]|nr:Peptidase family [Mucilaginibacter sp.]
MQPNLKPQPYTLLLYFVSLFTCSTASYAQSAARAEDNFKNHTYQNLTAYISFLSKTADDNTALLDKKLQKEYRGIIAEKNTDLIKELNDKQFLFDTEVAPYLNSIFNHVLEKNGLDKNQFHFFVNRTAGVNAYTYEEGTIVCNLGLLNIMENESQLAMVFCHELGHYLLKHANSSIISQLEIYHSPEFLAKVRSIKKQAYSSRKQLEELYKSDVFDRRKHNRSQERAADSLGIVLFENTFYSGAQVSHIFDLLAAAEGSPAMGTLTSFFKQENITIDEEWLKPAKKMSFGTIKQEIVDSLKTHPDCAVRKVMMQACFDKNPKHGQDFLIGNAKKLSDIKKTALFDEAAFSKENDNLSYYFYQLIQGDAMFPANAYIKSEIFATLVSLCRHQKEHTLYTVVSNQYIPEDNRDEYALMLKMFDSIDLATLTDIAAKYYTNNKPFITASPEAINLLKQFKN